MSREQLETTKEPTFFDVAKKNEQALRGILVDLQERFPYFPADFDFTLPIDELLRQHGASLSRSSFGRFTINDFIVGPDEENFWKPAENEAIIDVQDIAILSGGGMTASYTIQPDKSVNYKETLALVRS